MAYDPLYRIAVGTGAILGAFCTIVLTIAHGTFDPLGSLISITLGAMSGSAVAFMIIDMIARLPWKPAHRDLLEFHRVTRQEGEVAYAPRASAFRAFIDRAKRHGEFLAGGFNPAAYRASIAL